MKALLRKTILCTKFTYLLHFDLHRVMAVLDPVKVVITNLSSSDATDLEVPNIPTMSEKGVHKATFDPCDLYMDRSDLREVYFSCTVLTSSGTSLIRNAWAMDHCVLDTEASNSNRRERALASFPHSVIEDS